MTNKLKIKFGKNLKKIRIKRGLSCYRLAKLCNKPPQYLAALEAGKTSLPSEKTVRLICKELDINFDIVMKSINRLPQYIVDKILRNSELYEYNKNFVPLIRGVNHDY